MLGLPGKASGRVGPVQGQLSGCQVSQASIIPNSMLISQALTANGKVLTNTDIYGIGLPEICTHSVQEEMLTTPLA